MAPGNSIDADPGATSSRVRQAVGNNLLGKLAEEGLARILGEAERVAVRVEFNAAPLPIGVQRHVPAGNTDHGQAGSQLGGEFEQALEVGDPDSGAKGQS